MTDDAASASTKVDGSVVPDADSPAAAEAGAPSGRASTRARRGWVIAGAVVAVAAIATAVVVPLQAQAAEQRAAVAAYEEAASVFDVAVDGYAVGEDALTARYVLAADQLDGLLMVVDRVPDGVVDPVEAKQAFVDAVSAFRVTAGVAHAEEDPTTPGTVSGALERASADELPEGLSVEEIVALTGKLRKADDRYVDAATAHEGAVEAIDAAYDEAVVQLDTLMVAAQVWGSRDVFEKDTPEQHDALIAAAGALVKREGETFTGLDDRYAAIDTYLAAVEAARAGHDQTVAAEEAARQTAAAAEAAERAARERQQRNSGGGGSSNRGSNGGGSTGGGGGVSNNGGMFGGLPGYEQDCGGCWAGADPGV